MEHSEATHDHDVRHGMDYADMSPEDLRVLAEEHDLTVEGTGKEGRVLKADLIGALETAHTAPETDSEDDETLEGPEAVTRHNSVAWWCPECGHSNTLIMDSCGKCGASRPADVGA